MLRTEFPRYFNGKCAVTASQVRDFNGSGKVPLEQRYDLIGLTGGRNTGGPTFNGRIHIAAMACRIVIEGGYVSLRH
jgi:hypothetical protein